LLWQRGAWASSTQKTSPLGVEEAVVVELLLFLGEEEEEEAEEEEKLLPLPAVGGGSDGASFVAFSIASAVDKSLSRELRCDRVP
jgi:hypothetical protein